MRFFEPGKSVLSVKGGERCLMIEQAITVSRAAHMER
jgi:hypothetical protein